MKAVLREIFSDERDRLSSARIVGMLPVLLGCVLVCLGEQGAASVAFVAGCSLLGAGQVKSAIVSSAAARAKAHPRAQSEDI